MVCCLGNRNQVQDKRFDSRHLTGVKKNIFCLRITKGFRYAFAMLEKFYFMVKYVGIF